MVVVQRVYHWLRTGAWRLRKKTNLFVYQRRLTHSNVRSRTRGEQHAQYARLAAVLDRLQMTMAPNTSLPL